MSSIPLMILTTLSIQLPILIALLIGIILCFTHWKRHPKPSLLAFLGLLLLMILAVINVLTDYLPFLLQSAFDMKYSAMAPIQIGTGIVLSIMHAVGYVLLIAAIFSGRKLEVVDSTLSK